MNKAISRLGLGIIVFLGVSTLALRAEAETLLGDYLTDKGIEMEVSATIDYYDKYVWRGFLLDDDHVLQPGITLSAAGFEGGFWGSWDLQSEDALLNTTCRAFEATSNNVVG